LTGDNGEMLFRSAGTERDAWARDDQLRHRPLML
jgi:hypothetical protein